MDERGAADNPHDPPRVIPSERIPDPVETPVAQGIDPARKLWNVSADCVAMLSLGAVQQAKSPPVADLKDGR